jgi:hypothetical protein
MPGDQVLRVLAAFRAGTDPHEIARQENISVRRVHDIKQHAGAMPGNKENSMTAQQIKAEQHLEWQLILGTIKNGSIYTQGIMYGKPRTGHAEGCVKDHLADLDANLERLTRAGIVDAIQFQKLSILIHVHDTFKLWARQGSAIADPDSHASLARNFLRNLFDVNRPELPSEELRDLLEMVQYHDEGYALWKQFEAKGACNSQRLDKVLRSIKDLDLFLLFTLIDGYTPSKEHSRIRWFADVVAGYLAELKDKRTLPKTSEALVLFGI